MENSNNFTIVMIGSIILGLGLLLSALYGLLWTLNYYKRAKLNARFDSHSPDEDLIIIDLAGLSCEKEQSEGGLCVSAILVFSGLLIIAVASFDKMYHTLF
jgi:hypothetical protein